MSKAAASASSPYAIHWFRRDLRVAGNPALQRSWKEFKGRVVGLFSFDSTFLARPDFSHNRFAFFLETLKQLRAELHAIGSDLLVLDKGPDQAFGLLFESLKKHALPLPASVSFNRDYEPFARARDERVSKLLTEKFDIEVHNERDHLLIEPHELTKGDSAGSTYQVFTPFSRRWFEKLHGTEIVARIESQKKALRYLEQFAKKEIPHDLFKLTWKDVFCEGELPQDHCDDYVSQNSKHVTVAIPQAGSLAALARLKEFKKQSLDAYADQRDFPAVDGTSRLAMFFKNGSITPAQAIAALELEDQEFKVKSGRAVFLKEIVWREFYYHILFHHPRVESEAFLAKFKNLEWENNEKLFAAWKAGETGYPIVDAGMRQLNTTGWMHNRVRMIVASFLTKDLLINWQWGEKYFMEKLLDGDLAPNNGGWQWAASTGCDPQPYFRIFNPRLQSEKFDPEGAYIREYVPELSKLNAKQIHVPSESGIKVDYPTPIVDHQEQKERALDLYDVG